MAQPVKDDLTWYDATSERITSPADLQGVVQCDVCVIGGGLAGLTACLELSRKGKSVVLLEAGRVGSGASGRNGGFVFNGFALDTAEITKKVGEEATRGLYDLSRKGTEFVRSEILRGDPTLQMGEKLILVLRHPDNGGFASHGRALAENLNEDVEVLGQAETRNLLASDCYHASLVFPRAFHIHPLRYVFHLAAASRKVGARIFENCRALSVTRRGATFAVATAHGWVECQHVVTCVSSLDTHIHRPSGRAVLPVMTYIAVTEPLSQDLIRTRAAIADTRRAGDYYRLIDDNRLLWGGKITTRMSRPARLAQVMRDDMLATYPGLKEPRIDYAWMGQMGYAIHKMPLIGRDQEGQWFATAFGGHGLNTTAMAGSMIAAAIADNDDTYRRFVPFSPSWAYGQLGRAGVQGAYWWMQARDRFEEVRAKP
jgi:gamma-glutamylputrescine oxidase